MSRRVGGRCRGPSTRGRAAAGRWFLVGDGGVGDHATAHGVDGGAGGGGQVAPPRDSGAGTGRDSGAGGGTGGGGTGGAGVAGAGSIGAGGRVVVSGRRAG